jgi:outer membrane protein
MLHMSSKLDDIKRKIIQGITMKKLLASAIIAATPMLAQADLLFTVDAGVNVWQPEATGTVDDSLGNGIDLEDENFDTDSSNVIFVGFEHAIPFIPNVKFVNTKLDFEGDDRSAVDLTHTDMTLYWGLPLPIPYVDINFGLTARQFDGEISMPLHLTAPIEEDLDFIIPMGYLNIDIDTPFGIYGYVDVNAISYSGNGVTDTAVAVGYTLPIPLVDVNIEAGHRSLSLNTNEDLTGMDTDIDVAGMFFGVNLSVGI